MPRSLAGSVVGALGEAMITAGAVVLLFVAYQLVWTNVRADQQASRVVEQIEQDWAAAAAARPPADDPVSAEEPATAEEPARSGAGFARLYIPRLRDDVWGTPVLEGVAPADLARGVGHYPETAAPGAVGNFALAGHRATNGEPFKDIDRLRVGDTVVVETADAWHTYRLDDDRIVTPSDSWVVAPVPEQPGEPPTQERLTLTTCHPRWGSSERWVWWGTLLASAGKDGPRPAVLEGV